LDYFVNFLDVKKYILNKKVMKEINGGEKETLF